MDLPLVPPFFACLLPKLVDVEFGLEFGVVCEVEREVDELGSSSRWIEGMSVEVVLERIEGQSEGWRLRRMTFIGLILSVLMQFDEIRG